MNYDVSLEMKLRSTKSMLRLAPPLAAATGRGSGLPAVSVFTQYLTAAAEAAPTIRDRVNEERDCSWIR